MLLSNISLLQLVGYRHKVAAGISALTKQSILRPEESKRSLACAKTDQRISVIPAPPPRAVPRRTKQRGRKDKDVAMPAISKPV